MNHKLLQLMIVFGAVQALLSCESDDADLVPQSLPPVVEGWIDQGEPPVVIVTRAINLADADSAAIENSVEKWCRVTVMDGNTPYVLSGRKNDAYTPPFIYTTSRLKGQPGHTYRLIVETGTETAQSVATMQSSPVIDSIAAERVPGGEYQLRVFLSGVDEDGYYKFFCKSSQEDSRFYASFLGTFTGREYHPEEGWVVTRGIHSTFSDKDFSHFFAPGDVVSVRICSLNREVYDFWKAYDGNVSLSSNMFFTFAQNCPSNIIGGIGYWGVYGASTSAIRIPQTQQGSLRARSSCLLMRWE